MHMLIPHGDTIRSISVGFACFFFFFFPLLLLSRDIARNRGPDQLQSGTVDITKVERQRREQTARIKSSVVVVVVVVVVVRGKSADKCVSDDFADDTGDRAVPPPRPVARSQLRLGRESRGWLKVAAGFPLSRRFGRYSSIRRQPRRGRPRSRPRRRARDR